MLHLVWLAKVYLLNSPSKIVVKQSGQIFVYAVNLFSGEATS